MSKVLCLQGQNKVAYIVRFCISYSSGVWHKFSCDVDSSDTNITTRNASKQLLIFEFIFVDSFRCYFNNLFIIMYNIRTIWWVKFKRNLILLVVKVAWNFYSCCFRFNVWSFKIKCDFNFFWKYSFLLSAYFIFVLQMRLWLLHII